jgi:hypothetical protein
MLGLKGILGKMIEEVRGKPPGIFHPKEFCLFLIRSLLRFRPDDRQGRRNRLICLY